MRGWNSWKDAAPGPVARAVQAGQRPFIGSSRLAAVAAVLLLGFPAGAASATPEEQRWLQPEWVARVAGAIRPLPPSPEGPGTWAPWRANYYNESPGLGKEWGLDAKQLATFDRNLQSLLALLRPAPVLQEANIIRLWTPSGSLISGVGPINGVPMQKMPVMGTVMIGPWIAAWTKRDAKGQLRQSGETSHFMLGVNIIPRTSQQSWMQDGDGEFFPLYRFASPIPGTMALGHPSHALLVLRPGRPDPYAPITRERVVRAQIASYKDADRNVEMSLRAARQQLAEYNSPPSLAKRQREIEKAAEGFVRMNRMSEPAALERARARDEAYVKRLEEAANPPPSSPVFFSTRKRDELKAQLEAMSPAERAAPAWVSAASTWQPERFAFVEPNTSGAVPLVRVNPDFFDKSLPRTSIQVVNITKLDRYGTAAVASPERVNPPDHANVLLLRQVDWAAFAAALP